MVRILLIEDDSTIAAGLAYSLEQEGWSVTCKGTLAQGRNALETGEYSCYWWMSVCLMVAATICVLLLKAGIFR